MIFGSKSGITPYWFLAEVVDKDDGANAGRVRVRAFGIHPEPNYTPANDKEELNGVEDQDLPWAPCINGTYGKMNAVPEVGDWVFGFFADGREAQHPFILGTVEGSNLNASGIVSTSGGAVTNVEGIGAASTGDRGDGTRASPESNLSAAEVDEILGGESAERARQNAEDFLGRPLSDDEWNQLVSATVAESLPNSPEEQAAVMGVILNRVRDPSYPNTVTGVLNQPNQFQAVTGTSFDPGPSQNYTNPSRTQIASVYSGVNEFIPTTPSTWLNFTSNITGAYGPGTNLGFRGEVANSSGSRVIGGTVFGTVS